ncbi:unnamed protein product [Acanthoscelides obtectus]|uniref:Uncharacterized protein n=1 Tax=Acanthoscelides obtectus TaxID=200917 RepID=A0A9P0KGV4_ACAOB|nr:unnamed protein product [Acanthoscelides obtectus]CAK1620574.1 hypothetical protein AOBTE_LOCUS452 [Acanthoscelides obtectus]
MKDSCGVRITSYVVSSVIAQGCLAKLRHSPYIFLQFFFTLICASDVFGLWNELYPGHVVEVLDKGLCMYLDQLAISSVVITIGFKRGYIEHAAIILLFFTGLPVLTKLFGLEHEILSRTLVILNCLHLFGLGVLTRNYAAMAASSSYALIYFGIKEETDDEPCTIMVLDYRSQRNIGLCFYQLVALLTATADD